MVQLTGQHLLSKLLKKRGILSFESMTQEEKGTYNRLREALEGKKLTDEDVSEFWSREFEEITMKLTEPNISDRERDFLLVELRLAKKIVKFLDGPKIKQQNATIEIETQLSSGQTN